MPLILFPLYKISHWYNYKWFWRLVVAFIIWARENSQFGCVLLSENVVTVGFPCEVMSGSVIQLHLDLPHRLLIHTQHVLINDNWESPGQFFVGMNQVILWSVLKTKNVEKQNKRQIAEMKDWAFLRGWDEALLGRWPFEDRLGRRVELRGLGLTSKWSGWV